MFCFQSLEIPVWAVLFACVVVLLYVYGRYPGRFWDNVGVPSPPATLFIGHMDRIFDSETGVRYNIEKWSKQYGNIFGILFFRKPALVVNDVDIVKEVLVKDFNNYTDRFFFGYDHLYKPITKKGLFFNRGHDWRRIRRIMTPCFSSGKLKLLIHHINTTSSRLVETLQKQVEGGIQTEAKVVFSAYSLDALAGPAFGLDLNSHENIDGDFYRHSKGLLNINTTLRKIIAGVEGSFPILGFLFDMFDIRFLEASHVNYFEEQLTKLVMQRKADPDQFEEGDFLKSMIDAEAESSDDVLGDRKLSTEEIVGQCIVFVIAGYETTSATLQWLTYELAKKKDVQKRLREEIDDVVGDELVVTNEHCHRLKYMEAVINETLRMYPPLVYITRIAQNDRVLKGFTVPAETIILIPTSTICRNPDIFEDPDTFNPDRFMDDNKPVSNLVRSLPFGFGPRQCIGVRLAWLQLKIVLVHLLREFSIDGTSPQTVGVQDFSGLSCQREPINLILTKSKM